MLEMTAAGGEVCGTDVVGCDRHASSLALVLPAWPAASRACCSSCSTTSSSSLKHYYHVYIYATWNFNIRTRVTLGAMTGTCRLNNEIKDTQRIQSESTAW